MKLEYSGVCHSDVHNVRGETPMLTGVAGHEGVGKVVRGRRLYPDVFKTTMLINFCSTVGPGLDETKWMGERVGIRRERSLVCVLLQATNLRQMAI